MGRHIEQRRCYVQVANRLVRKSLYELRERCLYFKCQADADFCRQL